MLVPSESASRGIAFFFSLLLSSAALVFSASAADTFTMEKTADAPPAELPAALRDSAAPGALRVTGPAGVLCEIWLRKEVPAAAKPSTELGVPSSGRTASGGSFDMGARTKTSGSEFPRAEAGVRP